MKLVTDRLPTMRTGSAEKAEYSKTAVIILTSAPYLYKVTEMVSV